MMLNRDFESNRTHGIYARVSSDRQHRHLDQQIQEIQCHQTAHANHRTVAKYGRESATDGKHFREREPLSRR